LPTQHAINLQLLGGMWIIQTLPAIVIGLYMRWFHRWALLLGWAAGMIGGTLMAVSVGFGSTFTLHLGDTSIAGYSAFFALIVNLVVSAIATPVLRAAGAKDSADETRAADYTDIGPAAGVPLRETEEVQRAA
jgi:solute:Na+ symporter, SSS family